MKEFIPQAWLMVSLIIGAISPGSNGQLLAIVFAALGYIANHLDARQRTKR